MQTRIFLLLFFLLLTFNHSFGTITWQLARSEDCPFNFVFNSYKTMWKEGKRAYDLYFRNEFEDTWQLAPLELGEYEHQQEEQRQKKIFGYKLSIHYIHDNTCLQSERPTLYFHGWQDLQGSGKILKKFCKVLPGDLILFNFPDAFPIVCPFWKSSFGQKNDVLPALYTLNYVVTKKNLDAIDLFGASRGAATIINMIALLNNQELYQHYKPDLEKIGIDNNQRIKLLQVIQNGCIVLAIPLRTLKETKFPPFIPQYLTKWKKDGLDPMKSALLLNDLKLNILVHFQHKDKVVLNKSESQYFKNLAQQNPENTFLVMGNDGGHLNTQASLSKTVHSFKQRYGGSYDSVLDAQHGNILEFHDSNQKISSGKLIHFQNLDLVEQAIAEYHKKPLQ